MKVLNKMSDNDRKDKYLNFTLRYIFGSFIIFILAFMILRFPDFTTLGVRNGLALCMERLIPALYPFMILCNIHSSLIRPSVKRKPGIFSSIFRYIFDLPAECASVILFSFVGGLPVGALMSEKLYERRVISKGEWKRMLCFCVNPGPAFVVSSVGSDMLRSVKIGTIIYLSLIISSIAIGIISRYFITEADKSVFCITAQGNTLTEKRGSIIEESVVKSSKNILIICGWVIAFSSLTGMTEGFGLPEGVKNFIFSTAEMTGGCAAVSQRYPIPVMASVIGFSGFCGHFQLMRFINASQLGYKYFLISRIINSGLSAAVCGLLLKAVPVAKETFSVGSVPKSKGFSGSVVLSALMLAMAVLFILGDDFSVEERKRKKV